MKNKKIPVISVICFFVILLLLLSRIQFLLQFRNRDTDNSSFQIINFYKEDKNSLDAVFIGSSCCYAYYSPLFVYNSYGLKTSNYSSSGMGMVAYKYAIEEVRKRQEDALIVLTVTTMDEMNYSAAHFMSDYMPLSKNKIAFLNKYFASLGDSVLDSIWFYVPIMTYHDRWSELTVDDLLIDNHTKGATISQYYLNTINDISDNINYSPDTLNMPEQWQEMMGDLLDYCDTNNQKILFLFPPRGYEEEEYQQENDLIDYLKSRSYEVLDLRNSFDELGIDTSMDYYDFQHTNIHGSLKYSKYLAEYLMEHYGLKANKDAEFDKAYLNYYQMIKDYILDVEADLPNRDFSLAKPELLTINYADNQVKLTWNNNQDADGYSIYRKTTAGYVYLADSMSNEYLDENPADGLYTYTVISYRLVDNVKKYGNYDCFGLNVEVK